MDVKKFLLRFLSFASILLVLLLITDFWLSSVLRQSNGTEGEIQIWDDIYTGNIEADIAIYGSSRAWVHIDPKILKDSLELTAYNFGIDGHNFWLQYLRHKKYFEYNKQPKVIVLSVDVFSFVKRKDLYLSEQFLPYMFWDQDIRTYTKSYEGFEFADYYIPTVRYLGKRKMLQKAYKDEHQIPFRVLGFRGVDKTWNKDLDQAAKDNPDFRLTLDIASVDLFKKFIAECQLEGIQLIMVYTPEYIAGQKFVKNRAELFSVFENVSQQYDIPFLDYSNDPLNNKKEYFYNASHLNKKGAELFSKQFGSDLKTIVKINVE